MHVLQVSFGMKRWKRQRRWVMAWLLRCGPPLHEVPAPVHSHQEKPRDSM